MQSMNAADGLGLSPSQDFNYTMGANGMEDTMSIVDPFSNQTPITKQ